MLISYKPDDPDVPVWRVDEVTDVRRVFWCVRLWTGRVEWFKTRREAVAAYWR